MRFAITGGNGFIGSFLAEELLKSGHEVRIIDLIGHPVIDKHTKYSKADICDPDSLRKCFNGIEQVIHLAAYSKIQDCIKNPQTAFRINIGGTLNVLLAAKDCGVKRVVYASSSSIYGDQTSLPFKENMSACLLNPYAATKFEGEQLCSGFARWCGIETVSLRLFNVYGSEAAVNGEAEYPSVVERFLHQKRLGQRLTIIGNGRQKRDLVNVKDVIHAFIAASSSKLVGRGEVVNIGSGISYSVSEIADWIGGEIIRIDKRYIEAYETRADVTQARKFLNWQSKFDLKNWITDRVYKKK